MGLNSNTVASLRRLVAGHGGEHSDQAFLLRTLRLLAKWRSTLLANTLIAEHGAVVLNGPFQGMKYGQAVTEGALAARLLGSYESELHPAIQAFADAGLEVIVDIGCAEGFYAVGFARLLPHAEVHAHDVDARARRLCAELAERNGVADRVRIGGLFDPDRFATLSGRKVLIFMDAEGAEDDLLDPATSPALRDMKIIVETHEQERPGVTRRLMERFASSHEVQLIRQAPKTTPLPAWLSGVGHLDQLLVVWEWRAGPTPWLVMTPKSAPREAATST